MQTALLGSYDFLSFAVDDRGEQVCLEHCGCKSHSCHFPSERGLSMYVALSLRQDARNQKPRFPAAPTARLLLDIFVVCDYKCYAKDECRLLLLC